jgi:Sulfotransferase family
VNVEQMGPIYIGGPDRCGKTLLAAILGSHSRLAIPIVGSNLWTFFHGQYGDLANDRNLERCLVALQHYKHARFVGLDPTRLRADFRNGDRTYARLFALIHEHFAERQGKPRWGDQTGLVERYADEIFDAYPGVRMIQMIRDPRDRYDASLRLWPSGRARAGGAVARWRYSEGLGSRNLQHHPDGYRLLRYEDLVTDPEAVIREVCAFIGEEFEPAMLVMGDAPTYRRKLEASRDGRGLITPSHIGAFRGRIPTPELAFMQQQLRRQMSAHGYPPDPIRMTLRERLRYLLVDWPGQALRMVAWAGLESLQHRFAGIAGRRPSAGKVVNE